MLPVVFLGFFVGDHIAGDVAESSGQSLILLVVGPISLFLVGLVLMNGQVGVDKSVGGMAESDARLVSVARAAEIGLVD